MPADRSPNIDAPLTNKDGSTNLQWWKFWKSLAGQFSGKDAPLMPVNVPGVLSAANAQPKRTPLTEAAVIEAAQQLIAALPRHCRDDRALDLALAALRPNANVNRETGALDLATVALARIRPPAPPAPPQIIVCTQATFPTLAGTSPTFIYVSDFAHWIYWDGTTATFADGGSDYYTVAPSAPSGVGWHAVDGSTVSFLNADGTLTAKTLKNVAAQKTYLAVGSGADTLNAPTAPTISGQTDDSAVTITGATDVDSGAGSTLLITAGLVSDTVAAHTHTHGPGTLAGANHHHGLTAGSAPISTTGEPENFYSALWFRL
jgi:hypothetical protein